MSVSGEVLLVGHDGMQVQLKYASGCAACAKRETGCRALGDSLLPGKRGNVVLDCPVVPGVAVGDTVELQMEQAAVVRWLPLVACAYGLPTAGLLGGALTGQALATLALGTGVAAQNQFGASAPALGAVVGLAGGLLAWRLLAPWLTQRWVPDQCLHGRLPVRAVSVS